MNKKEIKKFLEGYIPWMVEEEDTTNEGENRHKTAFIGTYMSLDPCGRYHHIISPNSVTKKCERFWEQLNEVAEDLGGWIESGEGDPCDTFFSLPVEEEEENA